MNNKEKLVAKKAKSRKEESGRKSLADKSVKPIRQTVPQVTKSGQKVKSAPLTRHSLSAYALEAEMQNKDVEEVVIIPFGGNLRRVLFWLGLLFFLGLFLVIFGDVLLPFVAGFVLAYFLNPIVEFCEKMGISRLWATVMIVLVAVIVLVVSLVLLLPILGQQLVGIAKNIPDYFNSLQNIFAKIDKDWLRHYVGVDVSNLQNTLNSILGQAANLLKTILPSLWDSGKAVMNMATLIVVTPVVAFYMLLDWQRMVRALDSWIPRNRLQTVHTIVSQMNHAVAGFIRGQGTVCLLLACYYSIMLTLCGINFSLLIGLFIGLIAFIPYVGTAIGLFLCMCMACLQYWPDQWPWIVVTLCVFLFGQFMEGYVLQPKLVGSSVGLHPVWLMFALFAFGSLFGFTGMLIAIPAAAATGVLVRFALHSYLDSIFYKGEKTLNRRFNKKS